MMEDSGTNDSRVPLPYVGRLTSVYCPISPAISKEAERILESQRSHLPTVNSRRERRRPMHSPYHVKTRDYGKSVGSDGALFALPFKASNRLVSKIRWRKLLATMLLRCVLFTSRYVLSSQTSRAHSLQYTYN